MVAPHPLIPAVSHVVGVILKNTLWELHQFPVAIYTLTTVPHEAIMPQLILIRAL